MKSFVRVALAALLAATSVFATAAAADKAVLATDRDKVSYMIGMDVAHSLAPVAQDVDPAAFEAAMRNAFAGGKPALSKDEAMSVDRALRTRIAAREGKAPGAPTAPVAKDKVGQLLGGYVVGPSLVPIKDEIDLAVLMQGLRAVFANGKPLLTEAEADTLRAAFSQRMQTKLQARAAAAAGANKAQGAAFLAKNKAVKGVFTTPSGLQYMVLRQGAGPRPKPTDRVRVNYRGTLLDGTVFDSSYDRGNPEEFALNQVVAGWTEGLSLMPVGGKYRFWIPSTLGYGEKGTPGGPIGPNATLVFDVELLGILP